MQFDSLSRLCGTDEAPLQLAAVQLSHCVWGLHAWGPRGSDPTAGEVTAADPVPRVLTHAVSLFLLL